MGNRGILGGPWRSRAWITCSLQPLPGRTRETAYTKLFFSDEACALAAGHRPCARCSRERYDEFKRCWSAAQKLGALRAADIDRRLDAERSRKPSHSYALQEVLELPNGVFVEDLARPGSMLLVLDKALRDWSEGEYRALDRIPADGYRLLTPPSTVAAMRAGYVPSVSPRRAATGADGRA